MADKLPGNIGRFQTEVEFVLVFGFVGEGAITVFDELDGFAGWGVHLSRLTI